VTTAMEFLVGKKREGPREEKGAASKRKGRKWRKGRAGGGGDRMRGIPYGRWEGKKHPLQLAGRARKGGRTSRGWEGGNLLHFQHGDGYFQLEKKIRTSLHMSGGRGEDFL